MGDPMRIKQALKIVNWSAAGLGIGIFFLGKEKDYAWIPAILLSALALHFLIEALALNRQGAYKRRFADLGEFKAHSLTTIGDLEATLADGAETAGISLPAQLRGIIEGGSEKPGPLSHRPCLAYRLEAAALEGLAQGAGNFQVLDSWWSEFSLRDETGSVRLCGPGLLDSSLWTERIYTLDHLRSELPSAARSMQDALGIVDGKASAKARFELREVALTRAERVRVYGMADRVDKKLRIGGNDILDDQGSLLVRSELAPASSRMPGRRLRALAMAAVSATLFACAGLFVARAVEKGLAGPGGLFDASRTAQVKVDLDGRAFRIAVGDDTWDFVEADSRKDVALAKDGADFLAPRKARVRVEVPQYETRLIRNGDRAYPLWTGREWIMTLVRDSGSGRTVQQDLGPSQPGRGRLYIRNMTASVVTIRVLHANGDPVIDSTWVFASHEAADKPGGSYLDISGKGPLEVGPDFRLDLIMKNGAHRIQDLASVAKPLASGSWLLELVPEFLAGTGKLYVKNQSGKDARIWVLGAKDLPLYGEKPWTFDAGEGADKDKGLSLQSDDRDISFSGREAIRLAYADYRTVFEGAMEELAAYHGSAWSIRASLFKRP